MSLTNNLDKLLAEKEELISSIELACKSIEFWEKRAEKIFDQMDVFEDELIFDSGDDSEIKYKNLMKQSNRLMHRINFENNQLDHLESLILDLEERIIKMLNRYAKKQKK
jgi:glycyl-tRNA synthetase alpha subunit